MQLLSLTNKLMMHQQLNYLTYSEFWSQLYNFRIVYNLSFSGYCYRQIDVKLNTDSYVNLDFYFLSQLCVTNPDFFMTCLKMYLTAGL